jgi:hypothetical protein
MVGRAHLRREPVMGALTLRIALFFAITMTSASVLALPYLDLH